MIEGKMAKGGIPTNMDNSLVAGATDISIKGGHSSFLNSDAKPNQATSNDNNTTVMQM